MRRARNDDGFPYRLIPPTEYAKNESAAPAWHLAAALLAACATVIFHEIAVRAVFLADALAFILLFAFLRIALRWNHRENACRVAETQASASEQIAAGKEAYIHELSTMLRDATAQLEFANAWIRLIPEAKRVAPKAILAEAERFMEERRARFRRRFGRVISSSVDREVAP